MERLFRLNGYMADGSTTFEEDKEFYSLSECRKYASRLVAEAMDNMYCEIYENGNLLETVGDAVSYFLSNDREEGRVISCNDLDEAKEMAEDEKTSIYEYDRKTFKIGKCLWQRMKN